MSRLFGTDGVRGVANTELTPQLAYKLGRAGAAVLSKDHPRPVILVGKDTRISGDLLEEALCAGILSVGGDVIRAGVIPTPAVAYLVKHFNAAAGAMISASHNPFEYNGIKFFNGQGFKLDDAIEDEIEARINRDDYTQDPVTGSGLGRVLSPDGDPGEIYLNFLKSTVDVDFSGMKLVLDCANGASSAYAARLFRELGAEVTAISDQPDGININENCGSTHPENLQEQVYALNADLGLAFDGDADRLIAVDENGRVIDGDRMICVCAEMMKREGSLPDGRVTVTVMSNLGFHKAMGEAGCKVDVTAVGDRYVLESMLKTGSAIGGEQSGHIIFLNHSTTGDGMLSALQLLKAVKTGGGSLAALADRMEVFPQVLRNARIKNEYKNTYMENPEIREAIERIEAVMAGEGRVLIRPSGTEPLVRVMIEGKDQAQITALAEELAQLITEKLA
ncbi:MAG: phosphoglucosamine mutase [Firmicutes bacterium]|nr:phosphoglucosamine mutase [Bacillota bacterium]